jgi:hypothetical protein
MKTFFTAVIGVVVAVAGVAAWSTLGRAEGTRPAIASPVAAAVSFAKTGVAVPAGSAAAVRAKFALLDDASVSPAAKVDLSSIRSVSGNGYLADRSDGSVCLDQRTALNCFTGFDPGGIAASVTEIRMLDSETAPFKVTIDGIARDGVSSVTYHLNDGTSATAQVADNAFSLTIPDHVATELVGYSVASIAGVMTHRFPSGYFPPQNAPANQQK